MLPLISRLTKQADSEGTCDFDRLNISTLNVGGKGEFSKYTSLFDTLKISWRVIADRDALDDGSLKGFFARAGIVDADDFEARHKKLRDIGVAVLGEGEIEDYYPAHCLAELAGCGPEEVAGTHRSVEGLRYIARAGGGRCSTNRRQSIFDLRLKEGLFASRPDSFDSDRKSDVARFGKTTNQASKDRQRFGEVDWHHEADHRHQGRKMVSAPSSGGTGKTSKPRAVDSG